MQYNKIVIKLIDIIIITNNFRNVQKQPCVLDVFELLRLLYLVAIKTVELLAWGKTSVLSYII